MGSIQLGTSTCRKVVGASALPLGLTHPAANSAMACLARAQLLSVALGMLLPAIGLNGWSGWDYDGRGGEEGNCSWDQWSHQVGMSTVDRNGGIASNSSIIRNNGDRRTGLIFALDYLN